MFSYDEMIEVEKRKQKEYENRKQYTRQEKKGNNKNKKGLDHLLLWMMSCKSHVVCLPTGKNKARYLVCCMHAHLILYGLKSYSNCYWAK